MPIRPFDGSETDGAFEVVQRTLSRRAVASAFSLPRLSKADPHTLAIALPHRVKFLDLNDIRGETAPRKKGTRDYWRFLVLDDRAPIAAATAVRAEDGSFEFGGLDEGPFVGGTEEAVRRAEALIEVREREFEAVLLMVPALYVVALWLQDVASRAGNGEFSEADLLIAIPPSNPALAPWEAMTPSSFLDALRRAD